MLEAFLSAWSTARSTFGEGHPHTGAEWDHSDMLRQWESTVASAAPGSRWSGAAAASYHAVNTTHRRVLGELAELDKHLRAGIDQSAEIVAAGRRDLDAVRQWVIDAAGSVPPNADGERTLLLIVRKGIGEVVDIVQRSTGDLDVVGGRIRGIGEEYRVLAGQAFGTRLGGPPHV